MHDVGVSMTVWYSVCVLLGFVYLLLPNGKPPRH
jgi:hypothetical protein